MDKALGIFKCLVDVASSLNHVQIYNKIRMDVPQLFNCETIGILFKDIED